MAWATACFDVLGRGANSTHSFKRTCYGIVNIFLRFVLFFSGCQYSLCLPLLSRQEATALSQGASQNIGS